MIIHATTSNPAGLLRWLDEPRHVAALWLNKYSVLVAWVGLALAVISPPHGSGISVCWFQATTGLPCPGCGMTRSLSCGIRGMFRESWEYHPFGLFVLALFVATAAQSLFPAHMRDGLKQFIEARAKVFKISYLVFVIVFVSFGTTRALLHLGAACVSQR